jgi:tetratricopeptide (TPR) repeat protein
MSEHHHIWIAAPSQADRAAVARGLTLPSMVMPEIDAHRNHRGPYTAAGDLIRTLSPVALARWPELAQRHDIEILTVAPELRATMASSRETLTSLAVPEERTRFYSRLRTLRLAHGLTEFVRDHMTNLAAGPRSLVVRNVEDADQTDAELLGVLLRRIDPALLTLVICTGPGVVPDPLREALTTYARPETSSAAEIAPPIGSVAEQAASYVASDCTDEALAAAYRSLSIEDRTRLHDERADALVALDEFSLRLGAVPLHRERGSDPAGSGAVALQEALDYCIDMGFYDATVDLGTRGRAVIDWATQVDKWWIFTTKMTTSLAALGRPEEAEVLYAEVLATSDNASIHMQVAYATGMLYTRHHEQERKDHFRAKGLLNEAIAFASVLFEGKERLFHNVFNRNGLALVETHLGNLPGALGLVTDGLALLDRELDPDEHRLHRSVLRYNRAQVLNGLGRLDEALADYTAVIADDPHYPEYHFDRANILHKLGRDDEAIAEYDAAITMGPPFPEVHYNRAELLLENGETEQALAGLSYVIELEPTFTDAYVNRAGIHLAAGDLDAAVDDAFAGLRGDPANAHLHTVLGQAHAERGEYDSARRAFDLALDSDPTLVAALSGRATLAYEQGALDEAIDDLRRAVELSPDDPGLRYNRAFVYQQADRWSDALADLDVAAELAPDDEDVAAAREECRKSMTRV